MQRNTWTPLSYITGLVWLLGIIILPFMHCLSSVTAKIRWHVFESLKLKQQQNSTGGWMGDTLYSQHYFCDPELRFHESFWKEVSDFQTRYSDKLVCCFATIAFITDQLVQEAYHVQFPLSLKMLDKEKAGSWPNYRTCRIDLQTSSSTGLQHINHIPDHLTHYLVLSMTVTCAHTHKSHTVLSWRP